MKIPSRMTALALANVAGAVLLLAAYAGGRGWSQPVRALPASALAIPAVPIPPAGPSINWPSIRDRTIFQADRTWTPPEPPEPSYARPDYQLASALLLPGGKSVAFVRSSSGGPTRRLRAHDQLEGWTVTAIERQRVSLQQGHQVCELLPKAQPLLDRSGSHARVSLASIAPDGHRILGASGAHPVTPINGDTAPHAVDDPKLPLMRP